MDFLARDNSKNKDLPSSELNTELSSLELTRYSRNILLQGVGKQGQKRLKKSRVSLIGLGGLGSPIALYLASAGVGEIRIIDSDTVDLTNLQRQILYRTDSQDRSKVLEAETVLRGLNPEVQLLLHPTRLHRENISTLLDGCDLILEGSDNFETKFLVNDYAVLNEVPLIMGGILRFEGQISGIHSPLTSCYRCTFSEIPDSSSIPNCGEAGVLGSVAGVVGSLMATEALKFLIFGGTTSFGKILLFQFMDLEMRTLQRKKNPECPICGDTPKYRDLSHHSLETNFCKI